MDVKCLISVFFLEEIKIYVVVYKIIYYNFYNFEKRVYIIGIKYDFLINVELCMDFFEIFILFFYYKWYIYFLIRIFL